jgi:hypothetical protein
VIAVDPSELVAQSFQMNGPRLRDHPVDIPLYTWRNWSESTAYPLHNRFWTCRRGRASSQSKDWPIRREISLVERGQSHGLANFLLSACNMRQCFLASWPAFAGFLALMAPSQAKFE